MDLIINNDMVLLVCILIVADILTGIAKATKTHTLQSAIFRHGGYKKVFILLIICVAWSIDKIYFQNDMIYTASCTYYLFNEAISITENLSELGVPIPDKLKRILKDFRDKNKNDDERK